MNDPNLDYARLKPALLIAVVTLVAAIGLFASVQTAVADDSGNVDTVTGAGCMLDVYNAFGQGGGLNCTANDVSLATATNITILDDGCTFPGDTVSFTADFEVVVTAGERHDLGIYFAQDGDPNGDGALTGACSINTPAYAPLPDWLDLDGTSDDTKSSNDFGYCSTDSGASIASPTTPCDGGSPAGGDAQCEAGLGAGVTCEEFGDGVGVTGDPVQDTCGDISKPDFNPLYPEVTLTVTCVDDDGDGQLDLPYCTSWRQSGANELCLTPLAAYPGAPSKCNCDDGFDIQIEVPGQIIVDKVTVPAGDPTLFDFQITDVPTGTVISAFSLDDDDTPFESPGLDAGVYRVEEDADPNYTTTAACDDGSDPSAIDLQPGETVTCIFTNTRVNLSVEMNNNMRALYYSAGVELSWETVNESEIVGFQLYRRQGDENWQRINADIVPSVSFGQLVGAAYRYLDIDVAARLRYQYRLGVLDIGGSETFFDLGTVQTNWAMERIFLPIVD